MPFSTACMHGNNRDSCIGQRHDSTIARVFLLSSFSLLVYICRSSSFLLTLLIWLIITDLWSVSHHLNNPFHIFHLPPFQIHSRWDHHWASSSPESAVNHPRPVAPPLEPPMISGDFHLLRGLRRRSGATFGRTPILLWDFSLPLYISFGGHNLILVH